MAFSASCSLPNSTNSDLPWGVSPTFVTTPYSTKAARIWFAVGFGPLPHVTLTAFFNLEVLPLVQTAEGFFFSFLTVSITSGACAAWGARWCAAGAATACSTAAAACRGAYRRTWCLAWCVAWAAGMLVEPAAPDLAHRLGRHDDFPDFKVAAVMLATRAL